MIGISRRAVSFASRPILSAAVAALLAAPAPAFGAAPPGDTTHPLHQIGPIRPIYPIPPDNDLCTSAAALPHCAGLITASTHLASRETSEPQHADNPGGKSVWFRWTAPRDGAALFSTADSSFDTLLAAYTGTCPHDLTPVASNDNEDDRTAHSSVVFPIRAGAEYLIAVDGADGDSGDMMLSYAAGLANDFYLGPALLDSTCSGEHESTNAGARTEPDEPAHHGSAGGKSVWFKWIAPSGSGFPATYPVTFDTAGSDFDTLLGIYQGSSPRTATLVAFNDNAAPRFSPAMTASRAGFVATAGEAYHILVDGAAGGDRVAEGMILLSWDVAHARENDSMRRPFYFTAVNNTSPQMTFAQVGTCTPGDTMTNISLDDPATTEAMDEEFVGLLRLTNRAATKEPGEPNHAHQPGKRSVWFEISIPHENDPALRTRQIDVWTTPTAMVPGADPSCTATPCGSEPLNTLLAVYQVDDASALRPVAHNDDVIPEIDTSSHVSFRATSGVYRIAIDGKNGTSGRFALRIENRPAPSR